MEKRELNMSMGKSGSKSLSPKVSIPSKWAREMGITEEEREIEVTFDGMSINIKKLDKTICKGDKR